MIFTEIAVQNVAGFPSAARLSLKPGLNAFVSRETDLLLLTAALLKAGSDTGPLQGEGTPRKIALTITGDDGFNYRLIRDLMGGRSLLRSDPATRAVTRVSDEDEAIDAALGSPVGLPVGLFRNFLAINSADLPSRQPEALTRATMDPTKAPPRGIVMTAEEARRKLPELRAELARSEQIERLQDELQQARDRIEQLKDEAAAVTAAEKKVAEANQEIAKAGRNMDGVLSMRSRLGRLPDLVARFETAQQAITAKRAEYTRAIPRHSPLLHLARDPLVLGGTGLGVACIVLAFIAETSWPLVCDLLPFGLAAFGAWRWVDATETGDQSRRLLSELTEHDKRVRRQFESEAGPIQAALAAAQAASVQEALDRLGELDAATARRDDLQAALEQKRQDPRVLAATRERDAVEAELPEYEARVRDAGFSRSTTEIRYEVDAAETALGGGAARDPLAGAIRAAAEAAGTSPHQLLDGFSPRLGQYISALTDRRWTGLTMVTPDQYQLVSASQPAAPLGTLPPAERDLVWIAVRLAVAERVASVCKRPLLVDEPSVLVDAAHRGLLLKMLRGVGTLTQVIIRTYEAPQANTVDHIAQIGAAT
jgi:hypothetical protein